MEIKRSDLVLRIAEQCPQLTISDIDMAVKTIQQTMTASLCEGGRIEIRGFGSFALHHRKARIGRNPKTGEAVRLMEKYVPRFKPSKELNRRLNHE